MKHEEVKISLEKYVRLLEAAYEKISLAEDPKVYRITRILYLVGILGCFFLAKNIPEYRQVLGGVILLLGVFLLSSTLRYNVKKRKQKRAKKPFDQMLYQITEVSSFVFSLKNNDLSVSLHKKDGSERSLDFDIPSLSAFQWLTGAFLISNEEGIDFIIPEGLFEPNSYQHFLEAAKEKFENQN